MTSKRDIFMGKYICTHSSVIRWRKWFRLNLRPHPLKVLRPHLFRFYDVFVSSKNLLNSYSFYSFISWKKAFCNFYIYVNYCCFCFLLLLLFLFFFGREKVVVLLVQKWISGDWINYCLYNDLQIILTRCYCKEVS